MKRGGPLRRGKPLQADPEKTRAWQNRSKPIPRTMIVTPRQNGLSGRAPQPIRSKKPSDSPWRAAVIALRGYRCRRCGKRFDLQADHIMSRSQKRKGASVVENGMMLCREPCHRLVTENKIVYEYDWLDPDQVAWLAEVGYVAWDADGMPYGRGHRNFAPIRGAQMKGGKDGER